MLIDYEEKWHNYKISVDNENIQNCYFLGDSGTGSLNETQMAMKSSFVGFDFDKVWELSSATDYKYPQLRNNMQDPNKHVDIIEWKSQPTKIDFYTDEDIDPTGGVFTAYYIDDTHEDIDVTKDMLSGYDMTKLGVQTVTVSFREGSLTYDILTSTRPEVKSLTLETMPDKTEFARGTSFDFTGATAKVEYVNGKTELFPITAEETTGGDITKSGTYTISFEKFGKTVTFDVKVVPVKPIGINIAALPEKTTYIEGQSLDLTGLVVKLEYNSGKTETITDYTVGEYENTIGTKEIAVTYENFSTSFNVDFVEKKLTNIMVTTQPTKAKYVAGEKFDNAGMVVRAVYDNGASEEITDYTVSDITDATGWQNLTVSYEGKTTTVKVMVEAKELVSIVVAQMPTKTKYIEGESFDPEGMIVKANYNNVLEEAITGYTLSGTSLNKVGESKITVLYEGMAATFNVTVVEKQLVKITVTSPTKKDYIAGEKFDKTGMVVKAVYDNGKSEEVTDYTVSGFGDSEEDNVISVEYGGKTSAFIVTIHTPADKWTVTEAPSCTTGGSQELHCGSCGKVLKTETLEALDHDWSEWETVDTPNCTDKGSQRRTCSRCNDVEYKDVDPKGHTWETEYTVDKTPSCTEDGSESQHCVECGVINPESVRTIEKLPHEFSDWTITKEATCAVAGVKQRGCANCDYLETEEIAALGHDWADPEWTWSEDHKSASAKFTCKNDATHVETVDANVASALDETGDNTVYTAKIVIGGKEYTDTVTAENETTDDERLYGTARYDTAIAAAEKYKGSADSKFENVIVAYGQNFPDALTGGYLAKVKNAPILLVEPSQENRIVKYIRENIASGGKVYILGGKGVVSSAFESKIKNEGIATKRLGGNDRYETNMLILKEASVKAEDILVCTGNDYADSLSASAVGKPILLVDNNLSDAQKEYINGLSSKKFYLIGGNGAVSPAVEKGLKGLGFKPERIAGQSRYETSTAAAKKFFPKAKTVILAYAQNFPDGLSGGPLAMKKNAPIVLTDSKKTDAAEVYVKESGATKNITLGGPALISDAAVKAIMRR